MSEHDEGRIYTCNACQYTFADTGNPEQCPDCGKTDIRPATEGEIKEYHANHTLRDAADDSSNPARKANPGKDAELVRVLAVLQPYLQETPLMDVVWSDKYGYFLISIPCAGQTEDATVIHLDSAERLVAEVYQSLFYDYVEQFGDIEHCEDASPAELQAMRDWMRKYTDLLPEYDSILDEVLRKEQ